MSFEGYMQMLCENGHYREHDVWSSCEKCECGAKFVWSNVVDETNGEAINYISTADLTKATEEVVEVCNLGHAHVVVEATYKIPSPDETRRLRLL